MKLKLLMSLVLLALLSVSCMTTKNVLVLSDPPEAQVFSHSAGGKLEIGKTPLTLLDEHINAMENGMIRLSVVKKGYLSEQLFIDPRWSKASGRITVKLTSESTTIDNPEISKQLNEIVSMAAEIQSSTIKNDYSKAENLAKAFVTKYPNLSAPWILLGNVYYLRRRVPEALSAYRKSISLDPNNVEAKEIVRKLSSLED